MATTARHAGTAVGIDVDLDARGPMDRENGWSWPPYAPFEPLDDAGFQLEEWAPASSVRRPWVRVGRWTLLYRRAA